MGNLDISTTDTTDYADIDFADMAQHEPQDIDFFFDEESEYVFTNTEGKKKGYYQLYTPDWKKWKPYYNKVPVLNAIIKRTTVWAVGQGFKLKSGNVKKKSLFESKQKALERIKGNGTDNFNIIMDNLFQCSQICGDGFAEKIRDTAGRLVNLKPMSPGTITIVANAFGIIKGYKQKIGSTTVKRWKAKDIFHLPWNRISDVCHGFGQIEKLDWTLRAMEEGKGDLRVVFHRYVKPLWIFSIDTDNAAKRKAFKDEVAETLKKSENLVVPKKTVDSIERVSIPQYSTLDPLPWLKFLEKQFIIAGGCPEIVLGHGEDTTEASSKVLIAAWEVLIRYVQNWLKGHIKNQLGIELEFIFPPSIMEDLRSDEKKDSPLQGEKQSELKPTKVKM